MNPITLFFTVLLAGAGAFFYMQQNLTVAIAFFMMAAFVFFSLKMANAWEKFVILRAGKLQSVKGPGLFMIVPILDAIAVVIDERIQTTAFNAEQPRSIAVMSSTSSSTRPSVLPISPAGRRGLPARPPTMRSPPARLRSASCARPATTPRVPRRWGSAC